ncbi:hypothetical protein C8A01DRAFT_47808 [Parachaetomium inaequale]|uniref:non-specific serine/threonine protein kinase n=1 Tax=Parachaetomium inaequale TaxID=2588326 RepID=A0AAN6PGM3_9PEZI|nr:hypothetical protein C8A01DRAFT_47808 [Parachaetomium inaequale]
MDNPEDEATGFDTATCCIVRAIIDDLPLDVCAIDMTRPGNIVREWIGPACDPSPRTYYPSVVEYQLRCPVATVLRSQHAVVDRIASGVDKVVILPLGSVASEVQVGGEDVRVFRYRPHAPSYGGVWSEIQILSQLPRGHPNIVPLDHLILEEISGLGVVGYTTPFIDARSLDDSEEPPRPFKLKYLRELMALVDELNLTYGILHQDIAARNLVINPATDAVMLSNFSFATAIGHSSRWYPKAEYAYNDVTAVVILAYYLVTRDPKYQRYDLRRVAVNPAGVEIDHDPSVFYEEVMTWGIKRRLRSDIQCYTDLPHHLILPAPPKAPIDVFFDGSLGGSSTPVRVGRQVLAARQRLSWQRPPRSKLDKTRVMLATGEYAETAGNMPRGIMVRNSMRGFPQLPISMEGDKDAQGDGGHDRAEEDVSISIERDNGAQGAADGDRGGASEGGHDNLNAEEDVPMPPIEDMEALAMECSVS